VQEEEGCETAYLCVLGADQPKRLESEKILRAEALAEAIGFAYFPVSLNIFLKTPFFLVVISSPIITYVGAILVYQRKFHPAVTPPLIGA
jgi:hypothetical protein